MSVINFPTKPDNIRGKKQLAWWLREIATLVEEDKLEVDPHSIIMMLIGDNSEELLHVGGVSKSALARLLSNIKK